MSQVLRKGENQFQGHQPPPLPRRQVVAAVPDHKTSRPVTKSNSVPPPPPLAALRSVRPVTTQQSSSVPTAPAPTAPVQTAPVQTPAVQKAPKKSAPLQLALVPQWEDAAVALQPAPKKPRGLGFWLGATALTLATGALAAAGLMGVQPAELLSNASTPSRRAPVVHEVPVQYIEADVLDPIEFVIATAETAEAETLVPSAAPSEAELAVSITAAKPVVSARAAAGRRARRVRAKISALTAAPPPDPSVEAAARAQAGAAPDAPVMQVVPLTPALPERPTREQVRSVLEALRPMLQACAAGAHGKAVAALTISNDGRVAYSTIEGEFAGTGAGSCMARTVRGAQLPPFSGPRFTVSYPFAL